MGKSKELATFTDVGGTIGDDLNIEVTDWGGLNVTQTTSNKDPLVKLISPTTNSWSHQMDSSAGDSLQWRYNNTTQMQIDASGRVTMPYQPAFLAHDASTISSSAYRIYQQTLFNIGGAYSTSTGRFTAPVAGRYMFTFSDLITTPSSTTYAYTRPYLNGSHYTVTVHSSYNSSRSYEPLGATFVADMDVNDYMQIYTVISGSSTYSGTYTWFSGHLIG